MKMMNEEDDDKSSTEDNFGEMSNKDAKGSRYKVNKVQSVNSGSSDAINV